jgi:hypothetical protein
MNTEALSIKGIGEVFIQDAETGEQLYHLKNAINPRNMALLIARSLSHEANGYIASMAFGNGGTFLSTTSQRIFRTPNVLGSSSSLYNQTYSVIVDESTVGAPSTNSVRSTLSPSPALTALAVITCQLSAAEPANQAVSDNLSSAVSTAYTFDEIGLFSSDGMLLSHVIFSPIEKSANRSLLFTYTITISVS